MSVSVKFFVFLQLTASAKVSTLFHVCVLCIPFSKIVPLSHVLTLVGPNFADCSTDDIYRKQQASTHTRSWRWTQHMHKTRCNIRHGASGVRVSLTTTTIYNTKLNNHHHNISNLTAFQLALFSFLITPFGGKDWGKGVHNAGVTFIIAYKQTILKINCQNQNCQGRHIRQLKMHYFTVNVTEF